MFSPVDATTGYPARIWDKRTGVINKTVANYWRDNFDLQHILQRDWTAKGLGKKLQGKLHIFVGQSDTYYLNDAVYYMQDFLQSTVGTSVPYEGVVEFGSRPAWPGSTSM